MVFTEIDRDIVAILSTLVKYTDGNQVHIESIVCVGQYLGVPKDETLGIIEEWEEHDVLVFKTKKEKITFIEEAFTEALRYNDESVKDLYGYMSQELGISA